MKQPRDEKGRFIKIPKPSKGDNSAFLFCFSVALILFLNICFLINCNKYLTEFREAIMLEVLTFQQEIEQLVDEQNKIIGNCN